MEKLQAEQELRLECIITAFEHLNTMAENGITVLKSPYEIAEEMYSYVLEGTIPEINYN